MLRRLTPLHRYPFSPFSPLNPTTYPNSIPIRRPATLEGAGDGPLNRSIPLQAARDSSTSVSDHPPGFPVPQHLLTSRFSRYDTNSDKKPQNRSRYSKKVSFTIVITNISSQVQDEEIRRCCSVFGVVESMIRKRSWRGDNVSHCLIRFKESEQALKALKRLSGTRRCFRTWHTAWARKELMTMEQGEIEGVENLEVCNLLRNSWMLVMERSTSLEEVRSILACLNLEVAKLVQWGIHGVIAVCKNEGVMEEWRLKITELQNHFVKVKEFNMKERSFSRYCWIQVHGIPVQAWSYETMNNIAAKWGNLLAMYKGTNLFRRADAAFLFLEINTLEAIDSFLHMRFKSDSFKLVVKEMVREEVSSISKEPILEWQCSSSKTISKNWIHSSVPDEMQEVKLGGATRGQKAHVDVEFFEVVKGKEQGENREQNVNEGDDNPRVDRVMEDTSKETEQSVRNSKVRETATMSSIGVAETPFIRSSVGKQDDRTRRNSVTLEKEKNIDLAGERCEGVCPCCEKFNRVRKANDTENKEAEEVSRGSEEDGEDDVDIEQVHSDNRQSNTRGVKTGKEGRKQSLRKKSQRRVSFWNLSLKEFVDKNKNKRPVKRRTRRKSTLKVPSSSESDEIVRKGLVLCEELGLKIRSNASKRKDFELFIHGQGTK